MNLVDYLMSDERLKALHTEWHEEMRLDALSHLTGAPLEFQAAMEKIHQGMGDMFSAWSSMGTAQAASVSVLMFARLEALASEVARLKAEIVTLKQPAWARREGERE